MNNFGSALSSYFRTMDRWLVLFWLGATALSVLFQYGLYHVGLVKSESETLMMIIASSIGLVAAVIVSLLDYHFILQLWKLYLPACLVLMAMTFISAFATVVGDNQAWLVISLGGFSVSLQPSELLKISFITTFSIHLAKVRSHINELRTLILVCANGGAHILLVLLQNDTGSALIFIGIFLVMLFCAGLSWKYIAAAVGAVVAALPLLWFFFFSDDQKMRILVLFNPELSDAYTFQQSQSLNALALGGMQGNGVLNEAFNFVKVPKAYNDFIFSFIGQTCGFVGSFGVILLLGAIMFKILYNSHIAGDDEGRFICIGVFAMLATQTVINLGMCLGMTPVIGVTLPLFSAGGSSVLSLYLGFGLVLSVYRRSVGSMFAHRE